MEGYTMSEIIKTAEGTLSKDRNGDIAEYGIEYLAFGFESRDEAINSARLNAPVTYNGLYLNKVIYSGLKGDGMLITATYGDSSLVAGQKDEELQFNFSTIGGTTHITSGIECTARGAIDEEKNPAPDVKYIGWNGKYGKDCRIKGYNKITPQMKKTITRKMKYEDWDSNYENTLYVLTGKINNAKFMGHEKGSVLFYGANASGVMTRKSVITVNYEFVISPGETDIDLGNGFKVSKEGWSVLWTVPGDVYNAGKCVLKDVWCYITRIYRYGDFRRLGLDV